MDQKPSHQPEPASGAKSPGLRDLLFRRIRYERYKEVPLHRNKYVALLASFAISPLIGLYLMATGLFSDDRGQPRPAGWGIKAAILALNLWLVFCVATQSGLYRYGYLSVPTPPPAVQQQP
ncbi:hypothetical protein [Aestuariirhabdus litorea]|uniref:Uncharacterized protein n=1 Tax=Aestuariirhabdus litorea TaxID=2528527 RepID=A0A3P3VKP7_9GAMM|nr:hypothetical protein [Aestuariirhabdus litorea]RRJ82448.1 hypothetical protein D0544_11265 [Aestuariirhabdus litorea]RWW92610.1 hypothetical protein DZC74_11240 [Endozoicomonadaceae bacterium GTF-13]